MNPRVIKEVIKQLEHLGRYGNVKLQGRKRRKHLMLTAPIMKEELLDYLLSRKDTMEVSIVKQIYIYIYIYICFTILTSIVSFLERR